MTPYIFLCIVFAQLLFSDISDATDVFYTWGRNFHRVAAAQGEAKVFGNLLPVSLGKHLTAPEALAQAVYRNATGDGQSLAALVVLDHVQSYGDLQAFTRGDGGWGQHAVNQFVRKDGSQLSYSPHTDSLVVVANEREGMGWAFRAHTWPLQENAQQSQTFTLRKSKETDTVTKAQFNHCDDTLYWSSSSAVFASKMSDGKMNEEETKVIMLAEPTEKVLSFYYEQQNNKLYVATSTKNNSCVLYQFEQGSEVHVQDFDWRREFQNCTPHSIDGDGQYLYWSDSSRNSIVRFAIEDQSELVTLVELPEHDRFSTHLIVDRVGLTAPRIAPLACFSDTKSPIDAELSKVISARNGSDVTAAPIATATDGKSSMEVHQGLVLSTLAPVIKEDHKKVNTEDEKVPEKIESSDVTAAPIAIATDGKSFIVLSTLAPIIKEDDKKVNTEDETVPEKMKREYDSTYNELMVIVIVLAVILVCSLVFLLALVILVKRLKETIRILQHEPDTTDELGIQSTGELGYCENLNVSAEKKRKLSCNKGRTVKTFRRAGIGRALVKSFRGSPRKEFESLGQENDGILINIEDCCQMQLCETPCFTSVQKEGKNYRDGDSSSDAVRVLLE